MSHRHRPDSAPAAESSDSAAPAADEATSEGGFVIGVSNTLVGNGWREQMIQRD
ncbi:MAG: hypothetical protein R2932_21105 [Caldilineaceae bacterium]